MRFQNIDLEIGSKRSLVAMAPMRVVKGLSAPP
jgi:hypothetical protein